MTTRDLGVWSYENSALATFPAWSRSDVGVSEPEKKAVREGHG
ncbi:MAG TPA: hypothetical protein VH277_12785 [Gemmatimonadaceae bacterium]|jgi:hypothetical protein|nr:hypothetical protein [Gemmatimonadaceae bacterium]